jgi:hypothetical protein
MRYLNVKAFDPRTEGECVVFEVFIDNPSMAYKLGQIMACAERDFQELAKKYGGPDYRFEVSDGDPEDELNDKPE